MNFTKKVTRGTKDTKEILENTQRHCELNGRTREVIARLLLNLIFSKSRSNKKDSTTDALLPLNSKSPAAEIVLLSRSQFFIQDKLAIHRRKNLHSE